MDRQLRARAAGLGLAAVLAACASPPPAPPAPAKALPPPPPTVRAPAPAPQVLRYESAQRELAADALREGRFDEARRAFDIVLALRPDDTAARAGLAQAEAGASAAMADRLLRARQSQAHGDREAAMRLYVEALAADPHGPDAAQAVAALRQLEHDRARGASPAPVFARPPQPVRPRATASRASGTGTGARPSRTAVAPAAERGELEHATLLAGESEVDAAIALLTPLAGERGASPVLRAYLADLHFKQAQQRLPTDRTAALEAVQMSLRWRPDHPGATQLLKELSPAAKPPRSRSTAPRR